MNENEVQTEPFIQTGRLELLFALPLSLLIEVEAQAAAFRGYV